MAKLKGVPDTTYIALEHIRDTALLRFDSLFDAAQTLWSGHHLETLHKLFTGRFELGGPGSFLEKWKQQLDGASDDVLRLAAEILYVQQFFTSVTGPDKKIENVKAVLSWSQQPAPPIPDWAVAGLSYGLAGDQSFNQSRPFHLVWLIEYLMHWQRLPEETRNTVITDAWKFADDVRSVVSSKGKHQPMQEAWLYMMFPDSFENISSRNDKNSIRSAFVGRLNHGPSENLDADLLEIRAALTSDAGEGFSFYVAPILKQWTKKTDQNTDFKELEEVITAEHVRASIAQIEQTGVPAGAESRSYDLVYETKHYPPKLVLSLAAELATGKPFPRSDFEGGAETRAFKILRRLGFEVLTKERTWIFQANPDLYDIDGALDEFTEITWLVNRYVGDIKKGHRVVLWRSGKNAGIVALATVLTDPGEISEQAGEKKFNRGFAPKGDKSRMQVRLAIDKRIKPEISRQEVLENPILKSMTIVTSPQATNFAVTPEQAIVLLRLLGEVVPGPTADHSLQAAYGIAEFATESKLPVPTIETWRARLMRKRQIIIQGPPGTGKTYIAERLARMLVSQSRGFWDVVQFHPSYGYEDFMQGIRPSLDSGSLAYHVEPGRFLDFCAKALRAHGDPAVMIIDEINRANLSKVFGELMYLLEYRSRSIPLATGGRFQIPNNVYLIGTMNTADRSIALVDHALRRRFSFIHLDPNYEVLQAHLQELELPANGLISTLKAINASIEDRNYWLGISFFLADGKELRVTLPDIWKGEIEPYLEEFFFDSPEKAKAFSWDSLIKKELATWA